MSGLPTIDSHLHLWSLGRSRYRWLDSVPALKQDFTAAQARAELDAAGVAEAILVQADDTLEDTLFLLETAAAEPWIRGVVGWLQLDSPALAAAQLDRWLESDKFCGVRHLVHDDPRDGFLALAPVRESLGLLAAAGLPFDVPDAFPRHLGATAELAGALPELTVVVDHLGKPPLADPEAMARWRSHLAACAARPNTVAKLSGLHIPGAEYSVAALEPVFQEALKLFGPARLMYGGDWPVSVISGGYQPTWRVLHELIRTLSPAEQDDILAATANRVYRRGAVA
ncbi:amidohydrolase family protein [Arthrobacter sp. C9C5]|uniref:amidohydrolase family protein n=1 Tax=Arthrobacter sp. C9C5 TaxID=2735267 RepID=UPI0015845C6A|nr:amidohydrolase family protein [Arthrobacter sp. C9C5]NUU31719.1 amidohydrolase family protein [Arthrobacter sp. C9C5]